MNDPLLYYEDVIRLPWLPRRGDGAPISRQTWKRWYQVGVSGVKLRTVPFGKCHATTVAWLEAFLHDLKQAVSGEPQYTPTRRAKNMARSRKRLLAGAGAK